MAELHQGGPQVGELDGDADLGAQLRRLRESTDPAVVEAVGVRVPAAGGVQGSTVLAAAGGHRVAAWVARPREPRFGCDPARRVRAYGCPQAVLASMGSVVGWGVDGAHLWGCGVCVEPP